MYAFLLVIPYCELIFRISTSGDYSPLSIMLTLLFSAGYGAFIALFLRLSGSPKRNRILTGTFLFLTALVYMVEFFVYRSFKVFYDLDTVMNGAGGVLQGFMGDVGRLVFTFDGLSRIFLFLLPFLLYVLYLRKKDPAERYAPGAFLSILFSAAFLVASAVLAVSLDGGMKLLYDEEYNFQSAVETYGLSTALRLDVKKMIRKDELSFEGLEASSDSGRVPAQWERLFPDADPRHADAGPVTGSVSLSAQEGPWTLLPSPSTDREDKTALPTDDTAKFERLLPSAAPVLSENAAAEPASGSATGSLLSAGAESDDALLGEEIAESLHGAAPLLSEEDEEENEKENASSLFPEEQAEYGDNVLDIDFAALAETASGTKKDLDLYVASLTPSKKNRFTGLFRGKNLIFISAEAFSGDIIDPELTPTLYRLSTRGICFTDYYQPALAGTTGGEYENLFGLIPADGGKSMKELTQHNTSITIASHLCGLGYYGKAYHNNTYTIYGRDVTHNRLGFSDGFTGMGNGLEEYVSYAGFPESDLEMLENTFPLYADKQPFCIYYMSVSGHGQYGRSINRMSAQNYDRAADLPYSEIIKCYIANNLELEDGLTALVGLLEEKGIADDTVIVIGADHFPYGLDNDAGLGHMPYLSELYGYPVTNYLERDHNRLILWSGCLEKEEPVTVSDPVFSLDILPTLCNLFGVDYDSRLLPGRDVFSDTPALIFNGSYDWKTSLGTYIAKTGTFTPAEGADRIPEGYVDETKKIVRNKMSYCKGVLSCGYFDHVFGNP